jgi:hypothetical protein
MVVDLAVADQLQNCHAVEEVLRVGLASVHSDWDSSLLMEDKGGRCLRGPCFPSLMRSRATAVAGWSEIGGEGNGSGHRQA